jgi:hypothetical protein
MAFQGKNKTSGDLFSLQHGIEKKNATTNLTMKTNSHTTSFTTALPL